MVTFLSCVAALVIGYFVYGTIVEKVFAPNENNKTQIAFKAVVVF